MVDGGGEGDRVAREESERSELGVDVSYCRAAKKFITRPNTSDTM